MREYLTHCRSVNRRAITVPINQRGAKSMRDAAAAEAIYHTTMDGDVAVVDVFNEALDGRFWRFEVAVKHTLQTTTHRISAKGKG